MRSQLTTTLLFVLIFTLVLVTVILAERPPRPTLTHSPYLTQFSERDPWISHHVRFNRAILKLRRRLESFCRWVWDLVVPEVKPFREDMFYLRLLEDTVFLSARDVEQFSTRLGLQRQDHDNNDDDDIRHDILQVGVNEKELPAWIPS